MKSKVVFLSSLFFISGCSFLSPQKTPNISNYAFSNTFRHYHAPVHKKNKITVIINTPTAAAGFDTRKMIYTKKPYELSEFALNQWSAPPAEMLQPLLVQKLRDTGRFHAIMSHAYGTNREFILKTHLIELKQNFATNPSKIQITVQAEIINSNDNKVISTHTFNITQKTHQNTPYGGVVAANQAVDLILNQITEFTVRSLN